MHEHGPKKNVLSVFVSTSNEVEATLEKVEHCLSKLELPKHTVLIGVKDEKVRILNGQYTTLVTVTGCHWKEGMKEVCDRLRNAGFFVQPIMAADY